MLVAHEGADVRVEVVESLLERRPFIVDDFPGEPRVEDASCHLGEDTIVGKRRNRRRLKRGRGREGLLQGGQAALALRSDRNDFAELFHRPRPNRRSLQPWRLRIALTTSL